MKQLAWKYTASQTEVNFGNARGMNQSESQYVIAAQIAYQLTRQALSGYSSSESTTHDYELPQLAACVLMKFYLDLSYRQMEAWLLSNDKVCQVLGLPHVPHHTTLQKIAKKLDQLDFEKMKNQIREEQQRETPKSPLRPQGKSLGADNTSWISRLMVIWLTGIVLLVPVKLLNLPLNFEAVDIWILAGMPVVLYLYILRRPRAISLSFAIPMWFVLISGIISTFDSPAPTSSMIVIIKEAYLFTWFFMVLALLFQLNANEMRTILRVWSLVVICHGILMVAQFFSPAVWKFTNALGGNSARLVDYRAAGLFICDKAGCANKAAFFQLMGFVPLVLAGYSRRTTAIMGIFLLASMMTTGSMGATLAFSSGLIVAILTIAYIKNSLWLVIKQSIQVGLVLLILGGALYMVSSQNQVDHFKSIIIGRFDKSSSGRIALWTRGINVLLEHNAVLWGVGPENFRVVDPSGNDNQLHNDTIAFLVERGLLGLIGLALFAGLTLIKAVQIVQISRKDPKRAQLEGVIFFAVLVATIVESLTHQIFHSRELWLVLAVEEAILYKMITSEGRIEPTLQAAPERLRFQPGLLVQPKVSIDG